MTTTENMQDNDMENIGSKEPVECPTDDASEDVVEEDTTIADPPSSFNMTEDDDGAETIPSDGVNEDEHPQQPSDRVEVVAIPFINDGTSSVQLFYKSIFCKERDADAIHVAEKYFFDCFDDDEPPKWDGVFVCQYNFTKSEVVKDDRNGIIRLRDFKSNWLWKASDARENVTFNVKCTMPKVWASHFQSFLREMERYGQLGHSGQISFMADGDGNFKPKFRFTKEFESVQGIDSSRISKKAELLFDAG